MAFGVWHLISLSLNCKVYFIYFKKKQDREGETQRKWERASISWFTTQLATTGRAGPGQSSSQGLHPGLPHEWQKSKYLVHCLLLSHMYWQRTGLEMEQPGLKSALHYGMPASQVAA